MSHRSRVFTLFNYTSALTALLAASAHAQQSSDATSAAADSAQLSEIVVTAEKRDATVQTTPISLTAISQADLQARGATDMASLLVSVPGVSIRTSGPGFTEFEMRGVSSTGGNSPTVGFYYDDTLLTATSNSNEGKIVISPALYDVNRIEVLRGPQGTLYGSGSMGGTIKLVPNAPDTSKFDASAEVTAGGTDGGGFNTAENAMVNLPFGGGIAAVRIVGSYEHDSGWIDRIVTQPGTFPEPTADGVRGNVLAAPIAADHKDVNDVNRTSVRISALIQPVDGLSITPAFFYQRTTSGGWPQIDSVPGTDAHYQPIDLAENIYDQFKLSSLKMEYKNPYFAIDSNTAYWTRYEPNVQDSSESWATGLGETTYSVAAGGLGAAPSQEYNYTHQTTEELRVSSVGDGDFKWLLGYFYQDFESILDIYYPSQGSFAGETGSFPGSSQYYPNGLTNLFTALNPLKLLQQSFFGQATYNITPSLAATIGARRYTYETETVELLSGVVSGVAEGETETTSTSAKAQGVTPKFSLSYTFSPELMVYATAAKGFRPGGGTGPVATAGPDSCEKDLQSEYGSNGFVPGPNSFNADHLWSYELGEKWLGFNNRISVNAAGYFENWVGVQQTNNLPTCGVVYTANAGNAHVYGGELEIKGLITPEWIAALNTGYTHAVLVSADLQNSIFSPGTALQDDPTWTGSASLTYRHPLTDELTLTARGDITYVGSRTDTTYELNTLPSYQIGNIRAGVEARKWNAVLFINNVANKRALLSDISQDAINLPEYQRIAVNQPLTVGVDFNIKY
jgi:outer membrane receptor protein involved in Fe transport